LHKEHGQHRNRTLRAPAPLVGSPYPSAIWPFAVSVLSCHSESASVIQC